MHFSWKASPSVTYQKLCILRHFSLTVSQVLRNLKKQRNLGDSNSCTSSLCHESWAGTQAQTCIQIAHTHKWKLTLTSWCRFLTLTGMLVSLEKKVEKWEEAWWWNISPSGEGLLTMHALVQWRHGLRSRAVSHLAHTLQDRWLYLIVIFI